MPIVRVVLSGKTAEKPERLDVILLSELRQSIPELASLSRATLKGWFKDGRIKNAMSGSICSPSQILSDGNHLNLDVEYESSQVEIRSENLVAATLDLPILFEDQSLLVIHKRSGVPSVPQSGDERETAVGFALKHCPELFNIGRGPLEAGVLHRLDTGTSGVLVFAKTVAAFDKLKADWTTGRVRKKYRALVRLEQIPALDTLPREINFDLGHDPKSKKRMVARVTGSESIRGNPLKAQTILHHISTRGKTLDLEIEITTGVMHQIRCHLEAIGLPIMGDPVYGNFPASRLCLHAWRLAFPHPERPDLMIEIEADLPELWRRSGASPGKP